MALNQYTLDSTPEVKRTSETFSWPHPRLWPTVKGWYSRRAPHHFRCACCRLLRLCDPRSGLAHDLGLLGPECTRCGQPALRREYPELPEHMVGTIARFL